ncbi:unnamed protein product, partial [Meganyctiphanes norvegica]
MQSRRCMDHNGCRGDSVRYRVCNDVSCEKNAQEFRAVQCAEYDGLPHDGKLYEWEPALSEEPCSLTCRAKGGGPVVTLNSRVHDGTRCYDGQDDHMCINGRCQKIGCDKTLGSGLELDECGKCGGNGSTCNRPDYYWDSQPTGPCSTTCGGGYQILSSVCLDRKDSRVNEDRCDPSTRPHSLTTTCNDHTCPTRWQTGSWASCSASCGTGYQLREVYCTEPRGRDHVKVADHYCTNKRSSDSQDSHMCIDWKHIHGGVSLMTPIGSVKGSTAYPILGSIRGHTSYPTIGPIKGCIMDPTIGPIKGYTRHPISALPQHHQFTTSWWGEEAGGGVGLASEEGVAPLMPRPQALTTDQQVPSEPTYMTGNWSACSVTCGDGIRTRSVTCKIFLEFSRTVAVLPDDQCPGIKPPSSNGCVLPPCPHAMTRDAAHEPSIASLEDPNESFHINKDTDADGPKVHETPFLPLLVDEDAANTPQAEDEDVLAMSTGDLPIPQAQAYNKPHPALHSFEAPGEHQQFVPDDPMHGSHFDHYDSYEMANNKAHRRPVIGRTADMNSIEIDLGGGEDAGSYPGSYLVGEGDDYKWTTSGFSPCSVSCLGGVQESVVRCIRKQDEKIVDPGLCQLTERPDMITRTCNDQPCPPRWNITDFNTCSQQCGGGIQVREVVCIHEVTRGGRNTLVVPDSLCPQPPPHAQRHCNMLDCMPQWTPGKWSKCSKTCGGGVKTREVTCQQTLSLGQVVDKPHTDCPRRRPAHIRKCNKRACHSNTIGGQISHLDHPIIYAQIRQNYVQSKFMKKLTLKVGGSATVFRGVMVKVKCPVRRFDRSRITWWFEGSQVGTAGNSIVTSKGVLKIRKVQYVDAGVYICRAGLSEAKLRLMVKALPASFSSSEERNPPGGERNEVSQIGYGSQMKSNNNKYNKDYKTSWMSSGSERRKGRRRDRDRKKNKAERKQVSANEKKAKERARSGRRRNKPNKQNKPSPTQTTIRPILPYPSSHKVETLGEGPFKASSKNIHTVEEVSSNESSNAFDTGQAASRHDYVYGTVTHHTSATSSDKDEPPQGKGPLDKWDFGSNIFGSINHLTDENIVSKEIPPVFGKVNHHSEEHEQELSKIKPKSKGSRITSDEHHVFGTITHHKPPATTNLTDPPERTPIYSLESSGNSIEDDLKSLGNKLSLSEESSVSNNQNSF